MTDMICKLCQNPCPLLAPETGNQSAYFQCSNCPYSVVCYPNSKDEYIDVGKFGIRFLGGLQMGRIAFNGLIEGIDFTKTEWTSEFANKWYQKLKLYSLLS